MSTDLEDRIRASLTLHAEQSNGMPSTLLTERSMRQAGHLRRRRQVQVTAGIAVVAAAVASIPFLTQQQSSEELIPGQSPAPTATDPSAPADSAVAMARSTGALLSSGMTILDGDTTITVEPYAPPPTGWAYTITRLNRAGDGYWVEYGPAEPAEDTAQNPPPQQLVYVTDESADGSAVPVDQPDPWSDLTVEPGGTLVAFGGEASSDDYRLSLAETTGGLGGKRWPQAVSPLGFSRQSVWFSAAVDPGGPPYAWNPSTDSAIQLAAPQTAVALAQQGTLMILSDYESGCASGMDVTEVKHPQRLWRDCSNITLARFSPDGKQLVTILGGTGHDSGTAQLRDPLTGDLLAQTDLPPDIWEAEWTADGTHISLSGCCSKDSEPLLASLAVIGGSTNGWSLGLTSFPMTDVGASMVVLGVEQAQS